MNVIAVSRGALGELVARVEIGDEESVRSGDLLPHFDRKRYRVTAILDRSGRMMGKGATVTCRVVYEEGARFIARDERAKLRANRRRANA